MMHLTRPRAPHVFSAAGKRATAKLSVPCSGDGVGGRGNGRRSFAPPFARNRNLFEVLVCFVLPEFLLEQGEGETDMSSGLLPLSSLRTHAQPRVSWQTNGLSFVFSHTAVYIACNFKQSQQEEEEANCHLATYVGCLCPSLI